MASEEDDISELFAKCKDLDRTLIMRLTMGRVTVEEIQTILSRMNKVVVNIGDGLTLLHLAAQNGRTDLVEYLVLERNHPVELKTVVGETPLDQAAWKGFKDIAMILLKGGADVDCQTNSGYTPLHRCAFYNHPSMTAMFVLAGANQKIIDGNGKTAYDVAVAEGNEEIARQLKPLILDDGTDMTGTMYATNNPKHPNFRPDAREALFSMWNLERSLQRPKA